jgi:hypothetical protein
VRCQHTGDTESRGSFEKFAIWETSSMWFGGSLRIAWLFPPDGSFSWRFRRCRPVGLLANHKRGSQRAGKSKDVPQGQCRVCMSICMNSGKGQIGCFCQRGLKQGSSMKNLARGLPIWHANIACHQPPLPHPHQASPPHTIRGKLSTSSL